MALREVKVDGEVWTVWDVRPQGAAGKRIRPDVQGGWLAMQRGEEKRRVVPVPDGWEGWSEGELADAVRGAARVPSRM